MGLVFKYSSIARHNQCFIYKKQWLNAYISGKERNWSLYIFFSYIYIYIYFFMKVKVAQSRPTVCDTMDYSPLGSSVYGILQARILGNHSLLQGNLPDSRIELRSRALQADSLPRYGFLSPWTNHPLSVSSYSQSSQSSSLFRNLCLWYQGRFSFIIKLSRFS